MRVTVLAVLLVVACVSFVRVCAVAVGDDAATTAYQKGKDASAKKQWQTALTYFDAAIKAKPDFAKAYKERSLVHEAMGQYVSSIEDLARAGELDHSLEPPWMLSGRGAPWHTQQSINHVDIGCQLQGASSQCLHGGDVVGRLGERALRLLRARAYTKLGETEKAIADYTVAINFMPRKSVRDFANVVGLYGSRAAVYEARKETDKALADYTTIIDMKAPDEIDREIYYISRADLWKQRHDPAKEKADVQSAIDSYSRRINRTPYAWIIELRAELYARQKNYANAVADMQRVVKEEPTPERRRKLADYQKLLK